MSDNAPAKFVQLYGRGIMMNLHSIFYKVNANSNKLRELLKPRSSFRFQYLLWTLTTFFERAVYDTWFNSKYLLSYLQTKWLASLLNLDYFKNILFIRMYFQQDDTS